MADLAKWKNGRSGGIGGSSKSSVRGRSCGNGRKGEWRKQWIWRMVDVTVLAEVADVAEDAEVGIEVKVVR